MPPSGDSARSRRVTARDVAEAAGVSVALVSYAFNRPGRVAPATRERILQTAAAIGYHGPDPAARALRLGRQGTVSLRGRGAAEDLIGDPAAVLATRGLARACDQAGRSLLLSGHESAVAAVDGTVLWRGSGDIPAGGPTVTIDAPLPSTRESGAIDVGADLAGGVGAACRHLRGRGHARLAVISWPEAGTRLSAAVQHWKPHPLRVYEVPTPERTQGEVAARSALSGDERPDAILGLADELALGALDAALRMELVVPGDVAVCGVDDLPAAAAAALTSVFVPYRPLGDLAGAVLDDLIEGRVPAPSSLLPTSLTLRATA